MRLDVTIRLLVKVENLDRVSWHFIFRNSVHMNLRSTHAIFRCRRRYFFRLRDDYSSSQFIVRNLLDNSSMHNKLLLYQRNRLLPTYPRSNLPMTEANAPPRSMQARKKFACPQYQLHYKLFFIFLQCTLPSPTSI
ncbi:hypothetical protein AcW1_002866 [Taiwanofungus camphoratus]|nr:hypothetical protein AcW1_002866 [Antrodia cinnamomea]